MKKINLFAITILGLAVLFAGCNKNGSEFEDVKTVKVSDVTTVNGVKVQQKGTITNKAQFDSLVKEALGEDFDKAIGLAVSGDKNSGRAAVAEIGTEDFKAAFKDLGDQFKAIEPDSNGNVTLDIDWTGPVGKVAIADEGKAVEGADAIIEDLSLMISGSAKATQTAISGNIDASAKVGAALDITDVDQLSTIKNLKLYTSGGARGSNIKFTAKEVGEDTELDSLSGKLYIKYGLDSAMLFDVADNNGTEYNGVVKISATIKADQSLSKDGIEALTELLNKKNPTDEEIDRLPIDISVKIVVYDVDGNKLFDYFTADKLSEVINFGKEY